LADDLSFPFSGNENMTGMRCKRMLNTKVLSYIIDELYHFSVRFRPL
jgi:hypothetical protein